MRESLFLAQCRSGGVAAIGSRIGTRRKPAILAVVGLILVQVPLHALAVTVEVGGISIAIPEPNGYENVGDSSPEVRQLAAALTPPTNRLLAVFAAQDAVAEVLNGSTPMLPRYMLLQTSRQIENIVVSSDQFAQLRARTRQEQAATIERTTRNIGPFLEEASGDLSRRVGVDLELSVGESLPLGIFLDQDDAVGFAMITRSRIAADGQETSYLVVVTTLLMNVKNKVLFAYVYGTYEDDEDLAWARATARRWVEAINATN